MPKPAKSTKSTKASAKERPEPARRSTKPRAAAAEPAEAAETNVAIGSDLRIGRARELYAALTRDAGLGSTVIIDGADVAKVDAAGLQCVLAAGVHLRTAGATWRWHNPSPALKSAAQLLGLDGVLELT